MREENSMYYSLLPKKKSIYNTSSHVGDSMKNGNEFWVTLCEVTILSNLPLNPSTYTTYPT